MTTRSVVTRLKWRQRADTSPKRKRGKAHVESSLALRVGVAGKKSALSLNTKGDEPTWHDLEPES